MTGKDKEPRRKDKLSEEEPITIFDGFDILIPRVEEEKIDPPDALGKGMMKDGGVADLNLGLVKESKVYESPQGLTYRGKGHPGKKSGRG